MYSPSETISGQIGENMRRLLRQVMGQQGGSVAAAVSGGSGSGLRQSKGLREFSNSIRTPEGMRILDLGAASQANINFLTGLGHRLCTEDLHQSLELFTSRAMVTAPVPANGGGDAAADPETESERFFAENLRYEPEHFDGVLCWDLFDFLPDSLVKPLIARIHSVLKPGGYILAFFHSGQPGQVVPMCQYRITSPEQLQVNERSQGKLRRAINNRGIETLFREFASLKFFLTKDSLREVVVVR